MLLTVIVPLLKKLSSCRPQIDIFSRIHQIGQDRGARSNLGGHDRHDLVQITESSLLGHGPVLERHRRAGVGDEWPDEGGRRREVIHRPVPEQGHAIEVVAAHSGGPGGPPRGMRIGVKLGVAHETWSEPGD